MGTHHWSSFGTSFQEALIEFSRYNEHVTGHVSHDDVLLF